MRFKAVCIFLFFTHSVVYSQNDIILPNKYGSELINDLSINYYPSSSKSYNTARDAMYTWLDVDETDSLTCVYSGLRAKKDGTRTPSNFGLSFNTEHTWPQSFYDENEPMRGDIHHLFPTWSSPNQSRSNHPFAEINDNLTSSWWLWENGSSINSIPISKLDQYSEYYNSTFEPREDHKGNVARAVFYFWTMYQNNTHVINDTQNNQAFFDGMKNVLYQWHKADPVNSEEVTRSLEIESVQGNRNPFIHDTTLVRRAYFNTDSPPPPPSDLIPDLYISEVYEANGGSVKYVELFNYSNQTIDLTSGGYELIRYSNANTSGVSISLMGIVKSKSFFVIGDDNVNFGVQSIFGEGIVHQNSAAINHNGNDKYKLMRNGTDVLDSFSKDNIGNSSSFSTNQVALRIFNELPNDGSFNQTSNSSDGDVVSSGYWKVFDIAPSNSNASLVASPGYNSGIETNLKPQSMIKGNAGWKLLTIPGNNATLNELADDTFIQGIENSDDSNVFLFNSLGMYSSPATLNSVITNGNGLIVYFFDNESSGSSYLPITLDTDLEELSSDVSVPLNSTVATGNSTFTLVGNPFQSNIDLSMVTSDKALQNNIHILKDGLYETVSRSTAIIKPWQAFWVESSAIDPATEITFPISAKTENSATQNSFRKINPKEGKLKLSLTSSETHDKGCEIVFKHHSSLYWDIDDAMKLDSNRSRYSIIGCRYNSELQSILSLPIHSNDEFIIQLDIKLNGVQKEHQLNWALDSQLSNEFNFILNDKYLDQQLVLDLQGEVSFELDSVYKKKHRHHALSNLAMDDESIQRFELLVQRKTTHIEDQKPISFLLAQNYPNPFNPTTNINYSIPKSGIISLKIYNINGVLIETLINEQFVNLGEYNTTWDAGNLASGVYYAKLDYGNLSQVIKMLLLK